jgi:uncharacterized protein (DUF4213/DUF364 family)
MEQPRSAAEILSARVAAIDGEERIDRVVEGEKLVMVQTASGAAGVAMRPDEPLPAVAGDAAIEVVKRGASTDAVATRAVALATLNAIDQPADPQEGRDPFRSVAAGVDHVAMVGFFGPVFKHLHVSRVDVVERHPEAMEVDAETVGDVDLSLSPPEAAPAVLPKAEVVFITGSTLVYGGLGDYLSATRPDQAVILVGASASFTPAPLFEAGVTVVGGASPRDPAALVGAITDGECEAALHDVGLRKWAVLAPEAASNPALDLS